MITTEPDLVAVIGELMKVDRYGLDTEFVRERTYYPKLALIQVAWSGGLVLIDPQAVDIAPLAALFRRDDVLAIIHAASQDLEILLQEVDAIPAKMFDPQIAASFLGMSSPSLGKILVELLDVHVDKGAQLMDWTRRPLPKDALNYAASDVAHLLDLHDELEARLRNDGRLAWALEESERFRAVDRGPKDPKRAWWKLKGRARLRRRGQGVAQALCEWRLLTAREEDRPVKWVLKDVAMLALAQRPPKDARGLKKLRGVDAGQLKRRGNAILAAVAAGLAMEDDELCLPPPKPDRGSGDVASIALLAMAWISARSEATGVDGSILATRDEVQRWLRGDRAVRFLSGWRHELVGADLELIKSGARALTVAGDGLALVSL